MAERRRVPQPPIDRHARSSEFRLAWGGIALVLLAGVCLAAGMMAKHSVEQGDRAYTEYELNRAAVVGGVDKLDNGDDYCYT